MNEKISESEHNDDQNARRVITEDPSLPKHQNSLTTSQKELQGMRVAKGICLYSIPIIFGFLFFAAFTLVNTALLGNMENRAFLVAYGLVYMLLGLGMESIGMGFNSCLETLVA